MNKNINKETAKEIRDMLKEYYKIKDVTVKMGKGCYTVTIRNPHVMIEVVEELIQRYTICPEIVNVIYADGLNVEQTEVGEVKESKYDIRVEETVKEPTFGIKNSQAYERAKKNENKLEKKEKLLSKLKAKYNDYVSTHDMSLKYNEIEDYNDKWERIEIDHLPDRMYRIEKEVKKLKELIDRQYNQAKQEQKRRESGELTPQERRMEAIRNCPKELPQPLKDLSDQIEEREYQRLIEEFERKVKKDPIFYSTINKEKEFEYLRISAKRNAYGLVRSVWVKIYEHTGKVKGYKNVHIVGYELNGLFYGEKGNATVHTFFAGGYNIQNLHLRTRVTPFN